MKYVDVVIVGGAVVGSAAAYFLRAQTGFTGSVLVVEKDFSYENSATSRSAASIRHQFSTPENIRMSQFGTHFIQNIGDYLSVGGEVPDVGFHEGGYLFLATPAGRDVLEANHRVQRSLGVDVALLAPAQLQARFPWLNTSDLSAGSLGLSGEGWLDAYGLMQAFRRKAVSLGAEYQQALVTAVQRVGRAITSVTLSDGTRVNCGRVINAAGTGASALAQGAGLGRGDALGGQGCDFALQRAAHFHHLHDGIERLQYRGVKGQRAGLTAWRDEHAGTLARDEQAHGFKAADRFAHHIARDAKALGQLLLGGQALRRAQLAAVDPARELVGHPVREAFGGAQGLDGRVGSGQHDDRICPVILQVAAPRNAQGFPGNGRRPFGGTGLAG